LVYYWVIEINWISSPITGYIEVNECCKYYPDKRPYRYYENQFFPKSWKQKMC
jgi:hypothetical protein